MERKDSGQVNNMLAQYRDNGIVRYEKTLAIPFEQRIPELIKQEGGRERVSAALSASILSAFNNISKVKLNADQIIELSEGIIDSAHEDQLSIEDVLLFLRDMLMGKYGKISGTSMDMPSFFDIFEEYRDQRYKALRKIRWEEHLTYKSLGDSSRSFDELPLKRNDDPGAMISLMQTYFEGKSEKK